MTIAKLIPKPVNWQDFETLCKKLFAEVWRVSPHEIKKNGRSGQNQKGVDIYAIPKGEEKYSGIQCKGKDDYSQSKLTKKEILEEVRKAKGFSPPLGSFIVATTANKDADIEEFVRQQNLESQKNGSFEIQVLHWEDLADLIDESEDTYNWWVNEQRFRQRFDVAVHVVPSNGESYLQPEYVETRTRYLTEEDIREEEKSTRRMEQMTGIYALRNLTPRIPGLEVSQRIWNNEQRKNFSFVELTITLENTGRTVIENARLEIQFDNVLEVAYERPKNTGLSIPSVVGHRTLFLEGPDIIRKNYSDPITQLDKRRFHVFVRPAPEEKEVVANWTLYARDFTPLPEGAIPLECKLKIVDSEITTCESEENLPDEISYKESWRSENKAE